MSKWAHPPSNITPFNFKQTKKGLFCFCKLHKHLTETPLSIQATFTLKYAILVKCIIYAHTKFIFLSEINNAPIKSAESQC